MIIELDELDSGSVTAYLKVKSESSTSHINLTDAKITLRALDKNSKEYTINCNPEIGLTIVAPEIFEEFEADFDLKARDIGVRWIKISEEHGVIEVPRLKELVEEVGTLTGYFFVEYSSGVRISIPSGGECMVIKEAEKGE